VSPLVETLPTPSPVGAAPVAKPASPWVYKPWLDLLVGCGGWSAPLLAVALVMSPSNSHSWAIAFYLMAVIFNYPHFMATIYRAYRTRENFEKYKFVTLHVTLLVILTGVVMHASPRLFPWVFTLYIFWSPWHYSGQNFGLLMMFLRRSGAEVQTNERRMLRLAFVASYLMLLASFNTSGSNDPLILSLGLPSKFTFPARLALGASFFVFSFFGLERLVRKKGAKEMAAPLVLALTQFLWFVLPTLLELHSGSEIPQTRYSSGILAVLHSTQYLWITSYYQRREASAEGQTNWRVGAYFVTLVAGGIALFIPGPWLVSYLFHYDFTTSFLIFMSLVNLHHFILDGALWKLRDQRVSSVLVDGNAQRGIGDSRSSATAPGRVSPRRSTGKLVLRLLIVALLFLWGGFEQLHFVMRTDEGNLRALKRAASINPYDSATQQRIARAEAHNGRRDAEIAALAKAVQINPSSITLAESYARALLDGQRYEEAYADYQKLLERFPRDADALVNFGLLAAHEGQPEVAVDSWNRALEIDPNQVNANLYLAQAYDHSSEFAAGARHWKQYLETVSAKSDNPAAVLDQVISGTIQLGNDQAQLNQNDAAMKSYSLAIEMAKQANRPQLQSLALARAADTQEKSGAYGAALQSYQQALTLDAAAKDSHAEALDWFNYGQFLRRHTAQDELVYACMVRADNLLAGTRGADIETVQAVRHQLETKLGQQASVAQRDLTQLLARALTVPPASL
jgi:tetratricopeptide (TPR) repeat protein